MVVMTSQSSSFPSTPVVVWLWSWHLATNSYLRLYPTITWSPFATFHAGFHRNLWRSQQGQSEIAAISLPYHACSTAPLCLCWPLHNQWSVPHIPSCTWPILLMHNVPSCTQMKANISPCTLPDLPHASCGLSTCASCTLSPFYVCASLGLTTSCWLLLV